MKVGSLCSGYGGLDMAVEAFWPEAEIIWFAENDKDCSRVLAHHWPGVPNLGDLTTIDWDQIDPVDILCGGFPCQPFSHAGERRGDDDERAIFSYIADAVSVLRPGIVVLENVAGILTLGGPGVVGSLTGLGFDNIRWGVVRASDAGAPHRRARWFCVARSADSGGERHGGRENGRGVGHLDRRDESQTRQRQRTRPEPVDRGSEAPTDPDSPGRGEQRRTITMEPEQRPAQRGRSQTEWGHYAPAIERWERVLGRPAPDPTDDGKLSSRFVSWMLGLPDGWVTDLGMSRTAELKMLGNGVVPAQGYLALELLHDT